MNPQPPEFLSRSEAVVAYVAKNWQPVPVPVGRKGPIIEGWQALRIDESQITEYFGTPGNIGLILGDPSGGLTDADLDCIEAVRAAPLLLPSTPMVHGRAGAPHSHYWYVAPGAKTRAYDDPDGGKNARLAEKRSTGAQTMVHPSRHPETGELVRWEGPLEPAVVDAAELTRAVGRVAAAALLARRWTKDSHQRETLALALSGFLLRSGLTADGAELFMRAVCVAACDEEMERRVRTVRETQEKLQRGDPTTGGTRLADLVGSRVFRKLVEWLGLQESASLSGDGVDCLVSQFPICRNQENQENRANRESGAKPAKPPKPSFKVVSVGELLGEEPEDVAWLVDRMLPKGGLSIVGAKPKVGKSTLARDLSFRTARGLEFFGRTTLKGKVLYLALEEKRGEVQRFFQRMGCTEDDPIHVHVGAVPLPLVEMIQSIGQLIDEHKPDLLIIDPLLKALRVKDANDYMQVTTACEMLQMLARESGTHILCVHHLGKMGREGGDDLLGSTALFGAVDTFIKLTKRQGFRAVESLQRYGEDLPETVASLDETTGLVVAGGDVRAAEVLLRRPKVVEAIEDEPGLTEAEIKEKVGGNQALTGEALRALLKDEKVVRTGTGKRNDAYHYFLPDGNSSVSQFSDNGKPRNQENENRAVVEVDIK